MGMRIDLRDITPTCAFCFKGDGVKKVHITYKEPLILSVGPPIEGYTTMICKGCYTTDEIEQ